MTSIAIHGVTGGSSIADRLSTDTIRVNLSIDTWDWCRHEHREDVSLFVKSDDEIEAVAAMLAEAAAKLLELVVAEERAA